MIGAGKPRLRNTLRKLDRVRQAAVAPIDRGEAAQEALDFLALLAGLKPVFLLGRGIDDPPWIDGVLRIAAEQGLHVVEGPYWDAGAAGAAGRDADNDDELPVWFRDHAAAAFAERRAHYICRARATANEICKINAAGGPTVSQEARLLGYPECCVAGHYRRGLEYQTLWLKILSAASGGDEAEMRRMLASAAPLEPGTDDMRRRLEAAMRVDPAPFTSVNMCDACRDHADSPARRLSARYRDLAAAIDPGLKNELEIARAMNSPNSSG
jgi:hypothetical protein